MAFTDVLALHRAVERSRYATLCSDLREYRALFRGEKCLDYGCGSGMAAAMLLANGAADVVGVDPASPGAISASHPKAGASL